jgi:hypothetical protein
VFARLDLLKSVMYARIIFAIILAPHAADHHMISAYCAIVTRIDNYQEHSATANLDSMNGGIENAFVTAVINYFRIAMQRNQFRSPFR